MNIKRTITICAVSATSIAAGAAAFMGGAGSAMAPTGPTLYTSQLGPSTSASADGVVDGNYNSPSVTILRWDGSDWENGSSVVGEACFPIGAATTPQHTDAYGTVVLGTQSHYVMASRPTATPGVYRWKCVIA